jgi:hypothetical protein
VETMEYVIYNDEKYYLKDYIKLESRDYINIVDGEINLKLLGESNKITKSKEILDSLWCRRKNNEWVSGHALSGAIVKHLGLTIYETSRDI